MATEIVAAVTGIRAALDIAKAMVGLRDAEAFRAKSIELQGVVLDAFEKAIEARETYSQQADRIRALETEVTDFKAWDTEKQNYELKPKKGYLVPADHSGGIHRTFTCLECKTGRYMYGKPQWIDSAEAS